MTFVKVVKSKAYHKRYQVKYRRRRSGQTDYYARRRLIFQEKKKYNTPKYRLVVRKTNRDVIAQVVYSKMEGDFVLASAYGHELAEFGVKAGFNNYAACYATGLLVARRLLTSLKLADTYTGNSETNGEFYNVEDHASDEGPQPFRCFLDVGLAPTTTGARIFGVLKGAVDGGLAVPHNNKRFPGYDTETKKLDAEVHRDYIFGAHVGSYMDDMKNGTEDAEEEEDRREAQPEKYAKHFSKYIAAGITGENIEEMYEKAHEEIRKNPTKKKAKSTKESERKDRRRKRLTLSQRKDRVKQRKETFLLKLQAAEEE